MYRALFLCVLLVLLACGSSQAEAEAPARKSPTASAKTSEAPTKSPSGPVGTIHLPEELKGFDMAAVLALWQGDWVVRNQGRMEAWHVDGQALTTFREGKETTASLDLFGPCKAGASSTTEKGSWTDIVPFGIVEDRILLTKSGVVRQGDQIVGCSRNKIIYFDGSNCTVFDPKEIRGHGTEGYESETATCRLGAKPGYGDFFFYKTESMRREMGFRLFGSIAEIEAINMQDELLTKYASFEEAKAAL